MSELISGKEALIALANGEEVEWRHPELDWFKAPQCNMRTQDFFSGVYQFRLKPRTVTINGIEVPKPDYIQHGRVGSECSGWYIDIGGTYFLYKNRKDYDAVVAALRSIFNPK